MDIKKWYRNPTNWGWILTVIITVLTAAYFIVKYDRFEKLLDDPNNVGDFLAGTAGTVALIWLIVGYFLQREELHNNTTALKSQKDELEKQVEAMNMLAQATADNVEATRVISEVYQKQFDRENNEKMEKVRPKFLGASHAGNSMRITVMQNEISNVEYSSIIDGQLHETNKIAYVPLKGKLTFIYPEDFFELNGTLEFKVVYSDKLDNRIDEHHAFEKKGGFVKLVKRHKLVRVSG
ncbi:hypothetical protein [Marinicella sp. W31]|uniref:hypothetical protein n=1 Tax=Marinicella sp. W31 TaxID=3023713 RepID=UPI0037574E9B